MKTFSKGGPPSVIVQALASGRKFNELDSLEKGSIRSSLAKAQNGICAYCERSLKLDRESSTVAVKVEHYHPQSPGRSIGRNSNKWKNTPCRKQSRGKSHECSGLTWANLLLVCSGAGPKDTCDKSKSNTDICADFPNPSVSKSGKLVELGRDGKFRAASALPPGADKVIDEVLCLNARHLVDARREIIAAQLGQFVAANSRAHGLAKAKKREMAKTIRNIAKEPGTEFPSTLLYVADLIDAKA